MRCDVKAGPLYVKETSKSPARMGLTGELCVNRAHGKYYEAVSRGNVYSASMQAASSLGLALTATAVTLTLYNPIQSGYLLSLIFVSVSVQFTVVAGAPYVIAGNVNPYAAPPTVTTAANVINSLLGGKKGVGIAYTAATLPAVPIIIKHITAGAWTPGAGGTQSTGWPCQTEYTDGSIILQPNTAITIQGIGNSANTNGIVSMCWEEIAI
jgi:hypothetical protein